MIAKKITFFSIAFFCMILSYGQSFIVGTFNFGRNLQSNEIIDHIFVTAPFTAQKWGVLSDHYHGKFPSDHYPVLAVVKL